MPEDRKANYAAIARDQNISYQLLLKKIKSGLSLNDAIMECIMIRDARIVSGSRPHRSSRGQNPVVFRGTTYPTFAAACQAFGISSATAYAQRSRLMQEEKIMIDEASVRVLEKAASNQSRKRKRAKIVIDGIEYSSQVQAAEALGIPLGSIAARRTRDHISFEEAVSLLRQGSISKALCYDSSCSSPYLEQLQTALTHSTMGSENCGQFISLAFTIANRSSIQIRIFFPTVQFASVLMEGDNLTSDNDVNITNAKYLGIKFIMNNDNSVCARSDIPLTGRIKTDVAQILRVINHCKNVLSII